MASAVVVWVGDAPAVAQVATASIDTVDITPAIDTFTVTIGTLAVTQDATVNVAATAAALVVKLQAETDGKFSSITWSNPIGGSITAVAKVPGTPFTVALTVAGGIGTVTDFADTTVSSGPNDVSTAANWNRVGSGASLPETDDDAYIQDSASSLMHGLDQSAVDLDKLFILPSFTGRIGLPRTNVDDPDNPYVEYRPTGWATGASNCSIDATNALQVNIDFGTDQTACFIDGTGTPDTIGVPAVLITGNNEPLNTLAVNRALTGVGLGYFADGAATAFKELNVAHVTTPATDVTVTVGETADLRDVSQDGGTLFLNGDTAATTPEAINVYQGVCHIEQTAGTIFAINQYGGEVIHKSPSATTTYTLAGGVLDFQRSHFPGAITNMSMYAGTTVNDPVGTVTWTNDIDLIECSLADVTLNLGKNQTLARSAI